MRNASLVADGWWDYTTLDSELLNDAATLTVRDIEQLGRDGFRVVMRGGQMSGTFRYAEGLRKHNHTGFCEEGFRPIRDALGGWITERSERGSSREVGFRESFFPAPGTAP